MQDLRIYFQKKMNLVKDYFFVEWNLMKKEIFFIDNHQEFEEAIDKINEKNILPVAINEMNNFKKEAFNLQKKWKKIQYVWKDIWANEPKFNNLKLTKENVLKIHVFQKLCSN